MNYTEKRKNQIEKFIKEFKEQSLPSSAFTKFKVDIAENRIEQFGLIYSTQTMIGNSKSFTGPQLDPDVYIIVREAIGYQPRSRYYCVGAKDLSKNKA